MLRLLFLVFLLVPLLLLTPILAIRLFPNKDDNVAEMGFKKVQFKEAPVYQNAPHCQVSENIFVHVAMTLDAEYLRGSMAAIHSVLKHSSCPENVQFHFVASDSGVPTPSDLASTVKTAFPTLAFKVYPFDEKTVKALISSSIRLALDNPLNYARTYLADLLDRSINRVIYLDSDAIVLDDIFQLWSVPLTGSRVIGAPEYCHANFTNYFTNEFWSDPELSKVFEGKKKPCYFNTGVMIIDLERWREGNYRVKIEKWMEIQRQRRIYQLGSLPPFLLVFGGEVEAIDHRWNQHGLGGHNVVNSCRSLHPGPVSLMHWSGKGKPWVRLDSGIPCPVDRLWAPYDLYKHHSEDARAE